MYSESLNEKAISSVPITAGSAEVPTQMQYPRVRVDSDTPSPSPTSSVNDAYACSDAKISQRAAGEAFSWSCSTSVVADFDGARTFFGVTAPEFCLRRRTEQRRCPQAASPRPVMSRLRGLAVPPTCRCPRAALPRELARGTQSPPAWRQRATFQSGVIDSLMPGTSRAPSVVSAVSAL
eukprot:CAMPEP_0182603194 /NCGR_PEP_ID=MMETSP1324-20130603/92371_1 /TAXON_ID=236786 /ORGANISM="Florenciella sp., Strain RCC1587" /LENGTH=178 /DNA_ID=CAMNT_0024821121 /DNA_START=2098 /DNA_END=2635 /DNA_ORIENTATION=-